MTADKTVPATKAASELKPGVHRIAAGFLPGAVAADVIFVETYTNRRKEDWTYVAYREDGYGPSGDQFRAGARIPVEPVDDGLGYSREADDPTPVSPARVPLHTGSVVADGVLVTDEPELVTVFFSFGHGQTDPDTGKNLLDHYVTITGPDYEACRQAMFASKYGERWAFDYLAGTALAEAWIPQWTEHDRIEVTP